MDGFSLFGGLGSLVVAGLCYSAYRGVKDIASHLKVCMIIEISLIAFTAVSSDSRPPNSKCLTAIIAFDILAQSLISQQCMVSAQFWGKILHFLFNQFM